jgi:hypothetical protein
MLHVFFVDKLFGIAIDTLQVARQAIRTNPSHEIPPAFNLPSLFQFVSEKIPEMQISVHVQGWRNRRSRTTLLA